MAKRIKSKKAKTRTVVKTKVKRVYVKAKRAARRARRAASQPVSKKDIVLAVAGAGVGSVGGAIVLSKLPASLPPMATNGGVAALGGVLTYLALKKKNKLLMGAGLGMAAVGVRGIISGFVPTMAGYDGNYYSIPKLAAPFAGNYEPLAAPFAGEYEPLNAPFDGDSNDTI
ncbi:MAG: hypothetical protein J5594_05680 [Elusimicrobiaceae bacterium]|nr:hypothetical protein [Elusimicrobiaceae bacterium]MBR4151748.1 hypothetical protein [Selenomonadaceae bacterium]